jgi:hypothetical protein
VEARYHDLLGASLYQPTSWSVVAAMAAFYLAARWRLRRAQP